MPSSTSLHHLPSGCAALLIDLEEASRLFPEVNRLVIALLHRHCTFLEEQSKGLRSPGGKLRYKWLQQRFPQWSKLYPRSSWRLTWGSRKCI